jgi:hypothetical protein
MLPSHESIVLVRSSSTRAAAGQAGAEPVVANGSHHAEAVRWAFACLETSRADGPYWRTTWCAASSSGKAPPGQGLRELGPAESDPRPHDP